MQAGLNRRSTTTWLCGLACALAVLSTGAGPGARAAGAVGAPPCGTRAGTAPATYDHVIVIVDENESFSDVIGRPGSLVARRAPYLNRLAAACGLATNYRGITHPSHANYMALTGGHATPLSYVDAPSIFGQVKRAGGTWRVYAETMVHNCQRISIFPYKVQHNPAVAYSRLASICRTWDTNLSSLWRDLDRNRLPTYAFIVPNQCDNMHAACVPGMNPIRAGDAWLGQWIPRLVHSAAYRTGRTAIFVTWDEGTHGKGAVNRGEHCLASAHLHDISCHVATLVISPFVTRGLRSRVLFSHYSLLQTTERLLDLPSFLGHAADPETTGMRNAFGF